MRIILDMWIRMAFIWFGEKPVPVSVCPQVPQMIPYWMYGRQSDTGTGLSLRTLVVPCQNHSTSALYTSLCTLAVVYNLSNC